MCDLDDLLRGTRELGSQRAGVKDRERGMVAMGLESATTIGFAEIGFVETGSAETDVARELESRTGAAGIGREVDGGSDEEDGTMTESKEST